MQSPAYWVPTARWLAQRKVELVVPHLATLTPARAPHGTFERLVEMVASVAVKDEVLGRSFNAVLGHSAGAMLAIVWAGEGRGKAGTVLIDPLASQLGVGVDSAFRAGVESGLASGRPRFSTVDLDRLYPLASQSTLESIAAVLLGEAHAPKRRSSQVRETDGHRHRAHCLSETLRRLQNRVSIVRGARSSLCGAEQARELAVAAGGHARVAVIERAGHSPHVDDPHATSETLLRLTR
jgi:pimeloyl-ACP methyl ester carboxylesterase